MPVNESKREGDEKGRGLVLNHARASQKEETVGTEAFQEVVFRFVHSGYFLQR